MTDKLDKSLDLEQNLLAAWNVTNDIDLLCEEVMENDNLSKDGVLLVEEGGIRHTDEKLGSCAVWMACSCHGEGSTFMRYVAEFCLNAIAGSSHPVLRAVRVF
jgi:hypothetical protein